MKRQISKFLQGILAKDSKQEIKMSSPPPSIEALPLEAQVSEPQESTSSTAPLISHLECKGKAVESPKTILTKEQKNFARLMLDHPNFMLNFLQERGGSLMGEIKTSKKVMNFDFLAEKYFRVELGELYQQLPSWMLLLRQYRESEDSKIKATITDQYMKFIQENPAIADFLYTFRSALMTFSDNFSQQLTAVCKLYSTHKDFMTLPFSNPRALKLFRRSLTESQRTIFWEVNEAIQVALSQPQDLGNHYQWLMENLVAQHYGSSLTIRDFLFDEGIRLTQVLAEKLSDIVSLADQYEKWNKSTISVSSKTPQKKHERREEKFADIKVELPIAALFQQEPAQQLSLSSQRGLHRSESCSLLNNQQTTARADEFKGMNPDYHNRSRSLQAESLAHLAGQVNQHSSSNTTTVSSSPPAQTIEARSLLNNPGG